jgi:hypothetical protein
MLRMTYALGAIWDAHEEPFRLAIAPRESDLAPRGRAHQLLAAERFLEYGDLSCAG